MYEHTFGSPDVVRMCRLVQKKINDKVGYDVSKKSMVALYPKEIKSNKYLVRPLLKKE